MTRITATTMSHPAQWEGETDAGEFVYARYRGGRLTVDVAPSEDAWMDLDREPGVWRVFIKLVGDNLDSYMEYDAMKAHTAGVFEWPDDERVTLA